MIKKGTGALLDTIDVKTHPAHFSSASAARSRAADFFALTKPRLNFLVVITAGVGYYLGAGRDLHLMKIVEAVAGTALGFINELRFIGNSETVTFSQVVAHGLAESLVPLFFGFGCLTVAWLCVTLGLWRRP